MHTWKIGTVFQQSVGHDVFRWRLSRVGCSGVALIGIGGRYTGISFRHILTPTNNTRFVIQAELEQAMGGDICKQFTGPNYPPPPKKKVILSNGCTVESNCPNTIRITAPDGKAIVRDGTVVKLLAKAGKPYTTIAGFRVRVEGVEFAGDFFPVEDIRKIVEVFNNNKTVI